MSNKLKISYLFWQSRNKDPESYAKIYDLYVDKIFRFVYFKVSDRELAKDITSESFLRTWEYLISGKEVENLNALLYRIARNLVIDHYRKRNTQEVSIDQFIENQDGEEVPMDLPAKEGATELVARIDANLLLDKMSELKDEYREVLLLKYVDGFSVEEISTIMEKKAGAVRVTLHRAHKALQGLVQE